MKLEEAFKLYSDEQVLFRGKWKSRDYIPDYMDIEWLRGLHYVVKNPIEGMFIPPRWFEDVDADDWEVYEGSPKDE